MIDLRIATTRPLPEPDPDEQLLLAALEGEGIAARMASWREEGEDWSRGAPILVRSTWDYPQAPEAFLAWIERAARCALYNPADVLAGNVHKRYLLALEARGVPVVPTELVTRGAAPDTRAITERRGWARGIVVKPAIGAASYLTRRFEAHEVTEADAHLASVLAERDALVQPLMPAVETSGERALVWIDGEVTHAVRKEPRLAGGTERVELCGVAADERALAERALAPLAAALLYARVDLVRDDAGAPCIMELELLEPSLFLAQHPPALRRLASGTRARLVTTRNYT